MTIAAELIEEPPACGCMEEMDGLLAPLNARLVRTVLLDRPASAMRGAPTITVEKIAPRGKRPPALIPTFCPFCGSRYRPEPSAAAPQE